MKLQYTDPNTPDAPARAVDIRRREGRLEVEIDGQVNQVDGGFASPGVLQLRIDGRPLRAITAARGDTRHVALGEGRFALQRQDSSAGRKRTRAEGHEAGELTSSMPGQVLKVLVADGDTVLKGQPLVIIEAMKMEHEIKAPRAGRVKRISCVAGAMVSPGVSLVEIEAESSS